MCQTRLKSSGFTIAELLMSLAILAMLMAALATALSASIMNYKANEDTFIAVNSARQALIRMTSQIRTGLVDPNNIANEQECIVLCSDGSTVRFYYDNANDKLMLYDYGAAADYTLCDNVTAVSFKKDNSTPSGDVKNVRISMTVSAGDVEQTLAGAALARRVIQ